MLWHSPFEDSKTCNSDTFLEWWRNQPVGGIGVHHLSLCHEAYIAKINDGMFLLQSLEIGIEKGVTATRKPTPI